MSSSYCHLCGAVLDGRFKTFHHREWSPTLSLNVCQLCAQNKPRCTVCDLPMVGESPNGICQTCIQVNRYCNTCGHLIKQSYVQFDGAGQYCETCYHGRKPCDVCGAPLTDSKWSLSDGRLTCAYCHSTAIYDPVEATALYEQMSKVLDRLLDLSLNIPTGLALVDRNQLAEILVQQKDKSPNHQQESSGLNPQHTLGLYARRGIRRGIYIQNGLPRMLFLQVAAHEFAHAWQGENCPLLKDAMIHEGFAEWVAYRVLGDYGYTHSQERMCSRKDIYGKGLRLILNVENTQGIEGVYQTCRSIS